MFFFSGLASLICEVVWFKNLSLVVGSSTFAVSVVVACFFAGLSVGSWVVGRLADGWTRLLRAYALLEMSLCVVSAVVSLLLFKWDYWIELILPWMRLESGAAKPFMVAVGLILLLPATALMGATLPVLVKHLARQRSHLARCVGLLYGVNTLGAACGCALAGFALIGLIGVVQAALVGSALYGCIGVVALGLSRQGPATRQAAWDPRSAASVSGQRSTHYPAVTSGVLIAVLALSGFASIAYEVLWFRLLVVFNITTTYAFSAMLSTYLLGLVLGSWICARFLAPRKDRLLLYFARVQLLTAVAATVSVALLGLSDKILLGIADAVAALGITEAYAGILSGPDLNVIGLCLVVLLLPTTVIGVSFPLATELVANRARAVGSRVGTLYGLNTLAGVAGALVAGFALLPWLGSQWSFTVIVLLNLALFAVLLITQPSLRANRRLWREGPVGAAALLLAFCILGSGYLREAQLHYADAKVLGFKEDADATFVVLEYEFPLTGRYQQVVVNGVSYANNHLPGRRYMATLGHLPALLHPDPKSVVVIAIGTGTTVGALTLHPSIDDLWAVDISQHVFEVAKHFVPVNHDFLQSANVHPVVADGRHFLLVNDRKYDVLTFEPPPPAQAGVVNLYSRDFYKLAKSRLAEGGILCQWIPFDNVNRELLARMLIQTLTAEFPHVSLWLPTFSQGVAIASMEPLRIDERELLRRMAIPQVRRDMLEYGMAEPEQLLATFVTADEELRAYAGDAPVITDNRPRVEHFRFYPEAEFHYEDLLAHRRPVTDYLSEPGSDSAALDQQLRAREHIWARWIAAANGSSQQAHRHLEQALTLDPDNRYLQYQLASSQMHSDGTP